MHFHDQEKRESRKTAPEALGELQKKSVSQEPSDGCITFRPASVKTSFTICVEDSMDSLGSRQDGWKTDRPD